MCTFNTYSNLTLTRALKTVKIANNDIMNHDAASVVFVLLLVIIVSSNCLLLCLCVVRKTTMVWKRAT